MLIVLLQVALLLAVSAAIARAQAQGQGHEDNRVELDAFANQFQGTVSATRQRWRHGLWHCALQF